MKLNLAWLAAFSTLTIPAAAMGQATLATAVHPRLNLSPCREQDKALCFGKKLPDETTAKIVVPPVVVPDRKLPAPRIELKTAFSS